MRRSYDILTFNPLRVLLLEAFDFGWDEPSFHGSPCTIQAGIELGLSLLESTWALGVERVVL